MTQNTPGELYRMHALRLEGSAANTARAYAAWNEAHEAARKHRWKLSEQRDALFRDAKKAIEVALTRETAEQDRLDDLERALDRAHNEAKVAETVAKPRTPIGTVLVEWDHKSSGRYGRRYGSWGPQRKGRVFVWKDGEDYRDNIAHYRLPTHGALCVRIFKKDGTDSKDFVVLDRDWVRARWHREGVVVSEPKA